VTYNKIILVHEIDYLIKQVGCACVIEKTE